jgi:argininosuccinate synthase
MTKSHPHAPMLLAMPNETSIMVPWIRNEGDSRLGLTARQVGERMLSCQRRTSQKLISAAADLVIADFLVKDQPKPDFLHASFTVDGDERCGTLVSGHYLLGTRTIRPLISAISLDASAHDSHDSRLIPIKGLRGWW